MSDLPSVPDLDFTITGIHDQPKKQTDSSTGASVAAEAPPSGSPPLELPPQGEVGGLADLLEPGSDPELDMSVESESVDLEMEESPPPGEMTPHAEIAVPSPTPDSEEVSKRRSSATSRSRDTLADSMEEVLHQASDHALRMVHLEDMITEMHEAVATLRHEMLAREARQDPESSKSGDGGSDHRLASRLDAVEMQASRVEAKAGRLSLMAVLQIVLLGVILALLLTQGPSSQSHEMEPIPGPSGEESSAPELIEPMPQKPTSLDSKGDRKMKRKAKRRR